MSVLADQRQLKAHPAPAHFGSLENSLQRPLRRAEHARIDSRRGIHARLREHSPGQRKQGEERREEAPACVQPSSGSLRMRLPVAANIAFATAGAIGGVPGSPIPPGASVLGTICTSTFGISFMRSIR